MTAREAVLEEALQSARVFVEAMGSDYPLNTEATLAEIDTALATPSGRESLQEGRDHLTVTGKFQSDKFEWCPAGFVPLKVSDPMANDLLRTYARRRGFVDAEFKRDLEEALQGADKPDVVGRAPELDAGYERGFSYSGTLKIAITGYCTADECDLAPTFSVNIDLTAFHWENLSAMVAKMIQQMENEVRTFPATNLRPMTPDEVTQYQGEGTE